MLNKVSGFRICRLLPLSGAQLRLRTCGLGASISTDKVVDSVGPSRVSLRGDVILLS